jgi:nucleolar protein 15
MSDTEEQIEMEEPNQKMVLSKRPSFVNPKTYAAFDAKPKAPKASKKSKNKHKIKFERGYMYIGHIPHGFYEEQCKSYFSQFGRVCRIKLARSKATGKHKGYGFIEFENEEVAKIAADTMNNYLMFNKLLKCQLISKEKLHKLTFKNAKKNFFLKLDSTFRKRFNADKSDDKLKVCSSTT